MASGDERRLERRSHLIADGLKARISTIAQTLTPKGEAAPYMERQSREKALAWWSKHYTDELGQQVLAQMKPAEILALNTEISRYAAEQQGEEQAYAAE